MKFSKSYKQMCKKYNKELKKAYKQCKNAPYDFGLGFNFFIIYMNFMRDYYCLGENVYAEEFKDEYGNEISRLKTLNNALDAYYKWQNLKLGELKVGYSDEELLILFENFNKNYTLNREEFFKILCDYMEYWWD